MKFASKTMRIDLIPGIADVPLTNAPKQVVTRARTPGQRLPENSVIERAYRDFFQSIYDAGFITDLSGRIEDVNWRAVDFFGYSPEAFRKLQIPDLISGADPQLVDTLNQNLERERFTLIQAYCQRRDASYFPAEIAVSRIRMRNYHLCFFLRDITLRREAEEMLRTEHQAIQNAAEGIAVTDINGNLEYANPATLRILRYDPAASLVGALFVELLTNVQSGGEVLQKVLETGKSWKGEMTTRRSDGTTVDVGISAVCNLNTDGEPVGVVLSMADLTDHRLAEQARRESERQRVMLESLGTACHHLGQPATVLFGTIELLAARLQNADPDLQKLLGSAMDAANKMREIMARLREVHEYRPVHYLPEDEVQRLPASHILEI